MPIQSCTLPDGGSGYRWGQSGKCYADRAEADKQAAAAHANGFVGDADVPVRAAGTAFTAPTGRTLFVKRSAASDHPGEWCFPGGHIEDGETPEDAAVREGHEEIGARPPGERKILSTGNTADGVHFTTFRQKVPHEFAPRLNGEHTAHAWTPMSHPPQPLHPGVRALLSKMAMDRATIARRQMHVGLAFDRASVRSVDRDGRISIGNKKIFVTIIIIITK